jgi:hypothetical protein
MVFVVLGRSPEPAGGIAVRKARVRASISRGTAKLVEASASGPGDCAVHAEPSQHASPQGHESPGRGSPSRACVIG